MEGIRRKYFHVDVSSLRNLFESVDNQNIIDFIKETFLQLTLMFAVWLGRQTRN